MRIGRLRITVARGTMGWALNFVWLSKRGLVIVLQQEIDLRAFIEPQATVTGMRSGSVKARMPEKASTETIA